MQAVRGARARFAGPGGRFISAQDPLGASAAAVARQNPQLQAKTSVLLEKTRFLIPW